MTVVVQWGHMPYYDAGTWGSMLFGEHTCICFLAISVDKLIQRIADCSIASIVHALYGWRIYRLIARRWIAIPCVVLIALLSMAQFSCCAAAALFNSLQYIQGPGKQYVARKLFHGWVACATCADLIITAIMTIKLHSVRTGVKSTDRIINRIMYVTVPGGASTAIVTVAILIIQLTHTGSNYYQFLIISLTKVYSNSVLLCLNLRTLHRSCNGSSRRETFLKMPRATVDTERGGLYDVKIQRDVEKTSTVALTDLEAANQTMTAIEPMTPVHVGKSWQQSSMMTQSSQDEPYVTSTRGPILSTAHAALPIISYEHPFSSSLSSQSNTMSSPKKL